FQRWVGVSPKAFLKVVTLSHAKPLLLGSESLLDSSLAVGLSGPSRLHDLFVTVEAMTPGQYRARGKGMMLSFGIHPTAFGAGLFVASERGLVFLSFVEDEKSALAEVRHRWPGAQFRKNVELTKPYAHALDERM